MKRNNINILSDIRIVSLGMEHLDAVVDIENDTFSCPWSKDDFIDCIKSKNKHYFCAVSGSEVLGYCGYWGVADEAQIYNVAVKKEKRGKGIGGLLLKNLIDFALSEGRDVFILEVRISNIAAITLYRSLGFKKDGIRHNFYNYPVEDALLMSFKLKGEKC